MKVFKFGGASVKDAGAVRNITDILKHFQGEKIVIVISAMGKTTNLLEELTEAYFSQKASAFDLFKKLKDFHTQIMEELIPDKNHRAHQSLDETFYKLENILNSEPVENYNFQYDQIVAFGELLSTKIVSFYTYEQNIPNWWIDARSIIRTNNQYREAIVLWDETTNLINQKVLPLLEEHGFIITQGFIGATAEQLSTTLGREGSDYTAAVIGSVINASEVTVWKDVPGVLNADPKLFSFAKKMEELSYSEAIEMTYYGAKVLHPKTIKPLENKKIPLRVRSFSSIKENGSIINSATKATLYPPIIILKEDQVLIKMLTSDISFISEEHLSKIYGLFARYNVKINMMQNSAISLFICCDNKGYKIEPLLKDLYAEFTVDVTDNVKLLTIRHYNEGIINQLAMNKNILLEQRARNTYQMAVLD